MFNFIAKVKSWFSKVRAVAKGNTFLCDNCKWNYGSVCSRPERPNARQCPDYTAKS